MPRQVLMTTLVLTVIAALGGYLLGRGHARADLSGLVNAVAQEHARQFGGAPEACFGWIAEGEAMPRVTCGETVYRLDAFGKATPVARPDL